MSVTNPPTGASGPGSVGLGAVRGSLKRSVQASFEGESALFSSLSTSNNPIQSNPHSLFGFVTSHEHLHRLSKRSLSPISVTLH
jgi:hypothetical protein